MRRFAAVLLSTTLLLVGALACSDSPSEPDVPTVDGTWRGETMIEEGTLVMRLTLVESDDRQVTGNGTVGPSVEPDAIALSVLSGIHNHPDLSLTLGASGLQDLNFSAEVSENQIFGLLNGSGFTNVTMVLDKQQ